MSTLLQQLADDYLKGGAGSGNFNHEGRPGERGGSSSAGASLSSPGDKILKNVEKSQRPTLEEAAAARHQSFEDYKASIESGLKDAIEQATVYQVVTDNALLSLSKGDRLKNMYEVRTTMGSKSKQQRRDVEQKVMGIPKDTPDYKRPLYGYLSEKEPGVGGNHDATTLYGSIVLEYNDSVKERSTVTFGDSLATPGRMIASPANHPSIYSGLPPDTDLTFKDEPGSLVEGVAQNGVDHMSSYSRAVGMYTEAQIYGGIKLSDIRTVWIKNSIPKWQEPDVERLRNLGVNVKVYKSNKKSLKGINSSRKASDTKKERFEDFLDRAEAEGFLDGDQIDELRDKFESGTITDDDIPLALDEAIDDDLDPQQADESRSRLGIAILTAAIAARAAKRDELQTEFEDKVIALAGESSIPDWQSDFRDTIAQYILDMSTLGRADSDVQIEDSESLSEVGGVIQEQQAYLSRFADERAARAFVDNDMSDDYLQARSLLYSGQGRAEFFKGSEGGNGGADDDTVIHYVTVGDSDTCTPCSEAEGYYLPTTGPYPGEVCDGHGYCRCERIAEQDAELAAKLRAEEDDVEEKSLKGGPGSGNFNHEGRPGERGGSSSEGSSEYLPLTKVGKERGAELESYNKRFADEHPTAEPNTSLVRKYFGSSVGSSLVNTLLRNNGERADWMSDKDYEKGKATVELVKKEFSETNLRSNHETVYRRVSEEALKGLSVGDTIHEKGVMSTSLSHSHGRGDPNWNQVSLVIDTGKNVPMLWYPREAEIAFPPGTQIRITKIVDTPGQGRFIHASLSYRETKALVINKQLGIHPTDRFLWISVQEEARPDSLKGGPGSGNFNHSGRPGEKGGSGEGGGLSRDKDGTYRDASGKPVGKADQERLAAMKLPPAWTDVHLNLDPQAALQATGRDAKGRTQRVYSAEHSERMAGEKFSRLKDFTAAMPGLQSRIKSDLDSPDADQRTREAAAALYLIERTGFRVGSDRETGADKQAFGATTLRAEHVKVDGDKVSFSFIGKKGVFIEKTVTDGRLSRLLAPRVEAGGRLFNTSDTQVRDYLHSIDGNFKPKDFRTYTGTTTALREISRMPPAKDEKDFARLQLIVSKKVAETLGNTPTVARQSYIDPAVWGRLFKR